MTFINYIQEFNAVSIFIRLLLSVVLGGLLGMERSQKHQAAGVRTFSLVCLGSALIILTNEFICLKCGGGDTSRMAAQVISGIGFLGGGTIMITSNNRIKGLTTASCLWISAILGLCIGSGLIVISLVCFIILMGTLHGLTRYNDWIGKHNPLISLYLEVDAEKGVNELRSYAKSKFYHIKSIHRKREEPLTRNDLCISVEIDLVKNVDHEQILIDLDNIDAIHYVEEI
ncbi:MAG: MgtC/SapB family protein [Lachnospiraceae bacterium]|nr:MgtC/SapB family protein [Lachnospiraceae bacterium]